MKEFEGRSMRANVSVGTAGETILEHGFEQKIAEPRYASPTRSLEPWFGEVSWQL
jgi:hypothetical protein